MEVTLTRAVNARFSDGSQSRPGISFANDIDTGWYRQGADSLVLCLGGYAYAMRNTSGLAITNRPLAYGPFAPLNAVAEDTGTDDVRTPLGLTRASSGTPAAGFGAGILLSLESTTTAAREVAQITAAWDEPTDAARAATLRLSAWDDAAAREGIAISADGSAPRLGFLGATPTAKQTVTGDDGDNAALISLLNALATLGLITNGAT